MAYHIKKDGTPGVCHARQGNCPLGGDEGHFDTIQQAQEHADKINEQKFGVFSASKQSTTRFAEKALTHDEIRKMNNDELHETIKHADERQEQINTLLREYESSDNAYTAALCSEAVASQTKADKADEQLNGLSNAVYEANREFFAREENDPHNAELYKSFVMTTGQDGTIQYPYRNGNTAPTNIHQGLVEHVEHSQKVASEYEAGYKHAVQERMKAAEAENLAMAQIGTHDSTIVSDFGDSVEAQKSKAAVINEMDTRGKLYLSGLDTDKIKYSEYNNAEFHKNGFDTVTLDGDDNINNLWASHNGNVERIVRIDGDTLIGTSNKKLPSNDTKTTFFTRSSIGRYLKDIK